jgi:glutamyl-tRNA synthetase/glutamyl-Q tRNA(Asp) synthetase
MGAEVVLRIEDHDRGRCRPEYEAPILEDLDWLGLVPDQVSACSLAGHPSAFRQSDNPGRYQEALERLALVTPIYACECSRQTVAAALGDDAPGPGLEARYPGTCREAQLSLEGRRGVRAELPEESISFTDLRLGPIIQTPARQCGDLLLRDSTGNWTYQFCVVVDDLEQGIDLVVRGEDLLDSTGRQILLGRLLGRATPIRFLHHPLIRDGRGRKFSKRTGAASLRSLREGGLTGGAALGQAAWLTGLALTDDPLTPSQLGDLYLKATRR